MRRPALEKFTRNIEASRQRKGKPLLSMLGFCTQFSCKQDGHIRLYRHNGQITAQFVEIIDSMYAMDSMDHFTLDRLVLGSIRGVAR
jgi:hypothetical protein